MARTKNTEKPRKVVTTKREDYESFMRDVGETKADLDDARMANASAWKKADDKNIHAAVAKVMLKLRRMDDLKRNDWLRAFDLYREWEDFDESDLVDAAEEMARAEAQAIENADIEAEDVERRQDEAADRELTRTAALEESFEVTDADAEATRSPHDAGYQACLLGRHKVRDNPYDAEADEDSYSEWAEGWEEAFNAGQFGANKETAAA